MMASAQGDPSPDAPSPWGPGRAQPSPAPPLLTPHKASPTLGAAQAEVQGQESFSTRRARTKEPWGRHVSRLVSQGCGQALGPLCSVWFLLGAFPLSRAHSVAPQVISRADLALRTDGLGVGGTLSPSQGPTHRVYQVSSESSWGTTWTRERHRGPSWHCPSHTCCPQTPFSLTLKLWDAYSLEGKHVLRPRNTPSSRCAEVTHVCRAECPGHRGGRPAGPSRTRYPPTEVAGAGLNPLLASLPLPGGHCAWHSGHR